MVDPMILEGLGRFGVAEKESKAEKLTQYLEKIMLFNPSLKLVGEKSREEIISRHILDSASAYDVFLANTAPGSSIADLGTGAGLPGIVLSVLFPDRNFVLIDRMSRRIGFLRIVKASLRLENVEIVDKDISEVGERYSCITMRAFRPLSLIAEEASRLSENAILYKGQEKNISEELETLRREGYLFSDEIVSVSVPGEEGERNIVVMKEWRKA